MTASAVLYGPLGPMTLRESNGCITALDWQDDGGGEGSALLAAACRQLAAYFAGLI